MLLAINQLNLTERKRSNGEFSSSSTFLRTFFSSLDHENSRKYKEFVHIMKARIHQENEQSLLDNENHTDITNEDYDRTVQLPNNQQSKFIFYLFDLVTENQIYAFA